MCAPVDPLKLSWPVDVATAAIAGAAEGATWWLSVTPSARDAVDPAVPVDLASVDAAGPLRPLLPLR
jgi:hypothetical protein